MLYEQSVFFLFLNRTIKKRTTKIPQKFFLSFILHKGKSIFHSVVINNDLFQLMFIKHHERTIKEDSLKNMTEKNRLEVSETLEKEKKQDKFE